MDLGNSPGRNLSSHPSDCNMIVVSVSYTMVTDMTGVCMSPGPGLALAILRLENGAAADEHLLL